MVGFPMLANIKEIYKCPHDPESQIMNAQAGHVIDCNLQYETVLNKSSKQGTRKLQTPERIRRGHVQRRWTGGHEATEPAGKATLAFCWAFPCHAKWAN